MIIIYIFVFVFIIVAFIIALFLRNPKRKRKEKFTFQQQVCPTKCFDCINNNRSLNHLNVSHGHPRVYAT